VVFSQGQLHEICGAKAQRQNHCVLGGDGGELNYTENADWRCW